MSLELRKNEVAAMIDKRQLLPVELLIPEDKRRITVNEHKQFREAIATKPDFDEIDIAMADPIRDHRPQSAPGRKVKRVLGILDQLEKENSNRRFTT